MIRGLYTAAAGMLVQMERQNIIANNLANVDTPGFKKDTQILEMFPEMLISRINDIYITTLSGKKMEIRPPVGFLGTGVQIEEVVPIFTEGNLKSTGNKLDLAISGEGFFTVQTPQGIRYTRNGSFTLNSAGALITNTGFLVLGENGPIFLSGTDIKISEDGGIYSDGEFIDRLRIVNFPNLSGLQKIGDSLFLPTANSGGEIPAVNYRVYQGYLEMANVNTVKEMVEMIQCMRIYEANQKVIQSQDDTLQRLIVEVGRAI